MGAAPITMPLDLLMGVYRPAYGKDWAHGFELATANVAEADRVDQLRQDYRTHGRLRTPVRLSDESMRVGDGMHRMTALVAEGASEVEVVFESQAGQDQTDVIEVRFTCDIDFIDTEFEYLEDALTSFPIGQDWAQADGLFTYGDARPGSDGTGVIYEGWYYWHREQILTLQQHLVAQGIRYGARVEVISAVFLSEEQLQAL